MMNENTLAALGDGLPLWRRQVLAIVKLELRRNLFTKGSFGHLIFASIPIAVLAISVLTRLGGSSLLDGIVRALRTIEPDPR